MDDLILMLSVLFFSDEMFIFIMIPVMSLAQFSLPEMSTKIVYLLMEIGNMPMF